MEILAVNDSPLALTALSGLLESEGFEVLQAKNGLEALEILERSTCQIVVLDWEMPVMDGPEFCRVVRERFFARYIYIIFLTGHTDKQKELLGLAAGADDYVVKSLDSCDVLLARLKVARRILSEEACTLAIEAIRLFNQAKPTGLEDHGQRVSLLCSALLKELEKKQRFQATIDSTFRRHFFSVCPLYDIGYIALPDHLLRLRRGLDNEEFEVYKKHTSTGGQIFDRLSKSFPAADFFAMARDIATTHHERLDGSGFPVGLKGEAIPLVGRIVFLADTYDALTTPDRSVRPVSHEYAKWLISQGRNIHFDPDIVTAFLACEDFFIEHSSLGRQGEQKIDIKL